MQRRTLQHLAMTLPLIALAAASTSFAAPTAIHLEAEDATLWGPTVLSTRKGFSGTGYVSGFQKDGDHIVWNIPQAQPGIYEVKIRYSSPTGEKGFELVVNGSKVGGMFAPTGDAFETRNAGKVELRQGLNTVAIEKGWGYYDIDAIDIVPATIDATLKKPPKILVDPKATAKTRALHAYFVDLYGEKTLSGQYDDTDTNYIHSVTGQTPAIMGGDFMDYSPSRVARGTKPEGTTERLIQRAREGQIITMAWHWNAPKDLLDKEYTDESGQKIDARWYKGFYSNATTFDVQRALANPQSEDYKLLLRDMDAIAAQLKKFAEADIPILWRPLHEAEGRWFWWGAKGPEPLVQLWRLMFDRFTNHHGLHNLIWVYTIGNKPEWYPGDDYVDMVGIDAYPSDPFDPLSSTWEELKQRFDGKKLMALTEIGKVPDVEKMWRFGVRWSHFVSWTGDLGPQKISKDDLTRIYKSEVVLNREELKTVTVASAQTAPSGTALAPNAASYLHIANDVENNLQQHVLSKWFPAAVDRERGGFYQNFAEDWTRRETTDKSVVYQSRLTWMAAQEAMRSPQTRDTYREYSRHGLKFLHDVLWDKQHGGFFWAVDPNGQPATERGREKHVYGISFGMYAAAANYKATRDTRALNLAKRAFNWLESHAHDARNGGYYEALTSQGQPILVPPITPSGLKVDAIGTRYGYKSMNSHIHLLEAFTALYEVWPDRKLRVRLQETFNIVRDKIVVEQVGAMNLYFTPDWRALPDHDSFGHDVETAYLLVEASAALGKPNDARTWNAARRLVDHALEFGWDTQHGGFYDAGSAFGQPTNTAKIWWTQAEGLNALLLMHERFGKQTPRYWQAFLQQWDFISKHQIDPVHGGWYPSVTREGSPPRARGKSDAWTEAYHQGRALINVSRTLPLLGSAKPAH